MSDRPIGAERTRTFTALLLATGILSACAPSRALPALPADHPANPAAAQTPLYPPSTALAAEPLFSADGGGEPTEPHSGHRSMRSRPQSRGAAAPKAPANAPADEAGGHGGHH